MDLTRALVRTDLRHRWRSWLAIVLLVGVIGGVAMAAVAGYTRTNSAMERFLAYHRPANAYAIGAFEPEDLEAIPGVQHAVGGDYFFLAPVDRDGRTHPEHLGQISPFSADAPEFFTSLSRPIVVEGVLADPTNPSEVAIDEEMAELYDLQPGDRLTMQGYGMDQAEALFDALGTLPPTGPRFDFTVTGVLRSPQDVVPHQSVPDVVYLGSAEVLLGPAFQAAHHAKDVLSFGFLDSGGDPDAPAGISGLELYVDESRLGHDELIAAVQALDPEAVVDFRPPDASRAADEASRSIRLQGTLLLALGVVVSVGGVVLVSQALRRQLDADRDVQRSLAALGATRTTGIRVAAMKASLVAAASALVALAVAIALSPLAPVGHARRAEIDRGVDVDVPVLLVGLVAIVLLVVGFASVVAWRGASAGTSVPRQGVVGMSDRAAQVGLPPSVVAGVRAASLGSGASTVLVTVFVATVGIVGALGFVASEERLATDRDLWGWTYDVVVGDGDDDRSLDKAEQTLADNAMIESYAARFGTDSVTLTSGRTAFDVGASAIDDIEGTIPPTMLEGKPPNADDEIALGAATADKLGVGVGDEIEVRAEGEPRSFTVSGLVVMSLGLDADRIGEGALLALDGLEAVNAELDAPTVLVDYAAGVDPDEAYAALQADWGFTVLRPIRAIDVEQLHNVRQLPLWFSAFLAVVAAATLAFVLAVTIRRRRHDLALLRTLGFERRQLRSTVFVQSLVLVVPGTLLGVLGGVVVGRLAWAATARGMGAPEVHVAPVAAIAAVIVAAVLLALVVAAIPGRQAARLRPAAVLRTE